MKKVEQRDVISFIMYRFGILQIISIDQGTMFTVKDLREAAKDYSIKLLNSTP